jgi:hypothetical protein
MHQRLASLLPLRFIPHAHGVPATDSVRSATRIIQASRSEAASCTLPTSFQWAEILHDSHLSVVAQRVRAVTRLPMTVICRVLRIARRTAYYVRRRRRAATPGHRCHSTGADPRGDEQPRDVRLRPRVGDGKPNVPHWVQPQAHSPGNAAARPDVRPRAFIVATAGHIWSRSRNRPRTSAGVRTSSCTPRRPRCFTRTSSA